MVIYWRPPSHMFEIKHAFSLQFTRYLV
jgi:hypothetical protein